MAVNRCVCWFGGVIHNHENNWVSMVVADSLSLGYLAPGHLQPPYWCLPVSTHHELCNFFSLTRQRSLTLTSILLFVFVAVCQIKLIFLYHSHPSTNISNVIMFMMSCREHNYSCYSHVSSNFNRPISQIPECTCSISHNAPFRTEICTFLFWVEHCGIWNRCIVGFVNAHFRSELRIVGYGTGALWDLWIRSLDYLVV